MEGYNHKEIEKKWQEKWQKDGLYKVEDKVDGAASAKATVGQRKNYYCLVEFTYPSGNLHVGHWYAFAVPDIFARYKRMQGYNVLYPMGFDAFGLPAENAAIKLGADPKVWTYEQMDKMRAQFRSMGGMFPWEREVVSCDPSYYKWTQWMFNQFLKNDLVYRAVTKVNWCPKDKTVLANEQVIDGKCDRCGADVEQRDQEQWMLRITKYADRLIDDLEKLAWPEEIKAAQRNWIGRSEGSQIKFKVKSQKSKVDEEEIEVFTTRADTLFGVTYVVLAPEHSLISNLKPQISNLSEVEMYVAETKKKSELERQQEKIKTGVELKGIIAINPVNEEEVPVWVADYVLAGYGTGAVMAVPAHDERDFEFAKKYNLPIKLVIVLNDDQTKERLNSDPKGYIETVEILLSAMKTSTSFGYKYFTYDGILVNSGEFNGLTSEEARVKITEAVGGKMVKTYRLRDWGISRQRFWGTPIPIVYDPEGKAHSVPDEHLPWLLPTDVDHTPDGTAPLARSKELLERTEKIFGKGWKPEVETMDTFVDSSWYFYRYLDPKNDKEFSGKLFRDAWMPIDLYMGGAEHTTMHLLYSRFWVKAMHDLGMVKEDEAYAMRRNRGLILGPDGNKMSKSKGNVIDPDEIVERLGADTVRLYLGFMGPYGVTTNYPWDPNGVVGVRRFLERVWKLHSKVDSKKLVCKTDTLVQKTIKGVTEDIEEFKFNTAISKMMILLNSLEKETAVTMTTYKTLLQLLSPFAPHMTEELWGELQATSDKLQEDKKLTPGSLNLTASSIHLSSWPTYDPAKIVDEEMTIAIQINGKIRGEITVPTGSSEEEIKEKAFAHDKIKSLMDGKEVKKFIYVKNKLVSIVI